MTTATFAFSGTIDNSTNTDPVALVQADSGGANPVTLVTVPAGSTATASGTLGQTQELMLKRAH